MNLCPAFIMIYGDLTPFVPLSLIRRGGGIIKRGADAPLKHPQTGDRLPFLSLL